MGEAAPTDAMTAWQEAVVEEGPWLRGRIASWLDAGEPVEDVLQETLKSALERGQPAEPLRDRRAWLAGIARNKVRQHIDRRCRERRLEARVRESTVLPAGPPLPDEFLLDRERFGLVGAAMGRLDERARRLLRCKYVHGWSYARIGKELGMNEDAVTNGLRRARRMLRERLRELYDQPKES